MNRMATARPQALMDPRDLGLAAAVPALVVVGYFGISDPRVSGALIVSLMVAAWAVFAYRRPAAALTLSFPLLLLASTKFRIREANASLEGVLDAQILLELALFALVGTAVASVVLATRSSLRLARAELALILYAGIALLSVLWSAVPMLTLVRSGQLVVVVLFAIAAVRILTPQAALWTASRALGVYVVLCSALAAVFPWAEGIYNYEEDTFRFAWFALHPVTAGTLAGAAALGIASGLLFGRRSTSTGSRAAIAILTFSLIGILALTNTRGPALAFVAGAGLLWLMRVGPGVRAVTLTLAVVVPVLIVAFASQLRSGLEEIAAQDSFVSRAVFRGQDVDTLLQMHGRMALWTELRPAVEAQLFAGYGYQASRPVVLDTYAWAAYAHNALMQTVLDLGLAGVMALLAIIGMAYRGVLRHTLDLRTRAILASVVTFLVVNSVASESFAGPPSYEAVLLFLCACAGSERGVAS